MPEKNNNNKKKYSDADAMPVPPKAAQQYEREKERGWKEIEDSCDPHNVKQGQNTS